MAVFCLTGQVRAERPRSFSLNVVREGGAESCISSQRLASLVEQWVGPVFVGAGEGELAIETLLRRSGDRTWRARVSVTDHAGAVLGERELSTQARECGALDRQLVLVVVLAIDPEFALETLPAELLQSFPGGDDSAAELLRELQSEPGATQPVRDEGAGLNADRDLANVRLPLTGSLAGPGEDEESQPWAWEVSAGVGSGMGQLPNAGGGPRIALGVEPPGFWPLMLSATFFLDNDAELRVPTSRGDAIHFSLQQFGLSTCPRLWSARSARLSLCAGVVLDSRSADTEVLEAGTDAHRVSFSPVLGPEFGLALSGAWWLSAGIAAQAALSRDRYSYLDQFGEKHLVFRPAAVGVTGQVGLSLRL